MQEVFISPIRNLKYPFIAAFLLGIRLYFYIKRKHNNTTNGSSWLTLFCFTSDWKFGFTHCYRAASQGPIRWR